MPAAMPYAKSKSQHAIPQSLAAIKSYPPRPHGQLGQAFRWSDESLQALQLRPLKIATTSSSASSYALAKAPTC